MPNKIHPANGHVTGLQANGEQNLGLLLLVAAGQVLKISDVTFAAGDPCWFWLATANDGTLHVYSAYLAAGGSICFTFDTPIVLAAGANLYAQYNSFNVADVYEASFSGELVY